MISYLYSPSISYCPGTRIVNWYTSITHFRTYFHFNERCNFNERCHFSKPKNFSYLPETLLNKKIKSPNKLKIGKLCSLICLCKISYIFHQFLLRYNNFFLPFSTRLYIISLYINFFSNKLPKQLKLWYNFFMMKSINLA